MENRRLLWHDRAPWPASAGAAPHTATARPVGCPAGTARVRWERVMSRNVRNRSLWATALLVSLLGTLGLSTAPAQAAAVPVDATAASDWSGDGRADVVAPSTDGTLWLYRGDGAGGFAGTRTQIGSGWTARDQVRLVGGWDGAAGTDVIARDPGTGKLWLYSGDGAGGFRQIRTIGGGWQIFSQIFSPGDWDGDGHARPAWPSSRATGRCGCTAATAPAASWA